MNKIKTLFDNPIVKREIKQTFRKPKIFWIMAAYLFALAAVSATVLGNVGNDSYDPMLPSVMYFVILGMQMILLTVIVPITTSTAISGERERQTFDLLIITKTSMYDIILGKMLCSLMIVCIMIALSMPVYAVVFYYGGVSVIQFILNQIYMLCYVSMIGSLGIVFSAIMKKSTAASVATIAFIFAVIIGAWMALGMLGLMFSAMFQSRDVFRVFGTFFIFNPIISFMSMIDSQMGTDISWEVLDEIAFSFENKVIYCWHINMILYLFIAHLLINFAAKKIAPVRKK